MTFVQTAKDFLTDRLTGWQMGRRPDRRRETDRPAGQMGR